MLVAPGNHDINIVDRANPARLELPMSAYKRLRQIRALSAMERIQGSRTFVFDRKTKTLCQSLSAAIEERRAKSTVSCSSVPSLEPTSLRPSGLTAFRSSRLQQLLMVWAY